MPSIKTRAIVVRRADYRDNDRVLTLFSLEMGRIETICRGCRKQNSALKSASELFCLGEYVLYRSGEHLSVSACTVSDLYYGLRSDFCRLAHASYLLELCAASIQPDQENARLFLLLQQSLAYLCYSSVPARQITSVFLMGFVSLLGFRPRVNHCVSCARDLLEGEENVFGFDPSGGGILCPECVSEARFRIGLSEVRMLQKIMKLGVKTLEEPAEVPSVLFRALREMAEYRMETEIRSGKLLDGLEND